MSSYDPDRFTVSLNKYKSSRLSFLLYTEDLDSGIFPQRFQTPYQKSPINNEHELLTQNYVFYLKSMSKN